MKFRPNRGGLFESMAEVRTIPPSRTALSLEAGLMLGRYVYPHEIDVKPYAYDPRNRWDTHIVTVPGHGVIGFTDQGVSE